MSEATFFCDRCGEVAATLRLTDDGCLHSSGFWGVSEIWGASTLASAIQQRDARAIYRQDVLWAPFYCPECNKNYCHKHWIIIPQFDSDFPGWYDCAYGTCPEGHRRLIDD